MAFTIPHSLTIDSCLDLKARCPKQNFMSCERAWKEASETKQPAENCAEDFRSVWSGVKKMARSFFIRMNLFAEPCAPSSSVSPKPDRCVKSGFGSDPKNSPSHFSRIPCPKSAG